MDRWDLINQGEPRPRRGSDNKTWLNSKRNSNVVKSSRNKEASSEEVRGKVGKILLRNQVRGKESVCLILTH